MKRIARNPRSASGLRMALFSLLANPFLFAEVPRDQYLSSIQLAVYEQSPELLRRSQKIVLDRFHNTFESWPEFKGREYEVKQNGNEITFIMTTPEDMRTPMQLAVSNIIEHLNGRVRARGKSMFYRTQFTKPSGGYLEVTVDDSKTGILSISAQSVPLRDLLKEIKSQIGSISYLIPGECAEQLVDWSFGENEPGVQTKSLDVAMGELASLFNLSLDTADKNGKKNGTYIFKGACDPHQRHVRPPADLRMELLRNSFLTPSDAGHPGRLMGARVHQVFVPLMPLGD